MIYLSEFILNERSKWRAMVAAGKVGTKDLRRLKKAGIIKPEHEEMKRLNTATKKIMDKANMKAAPYKSPGTTSGALVQKFTGIKLKLPKSKILKPITDRLRKADHKKGTKHIANGPLTAYKTIDNKKGSILFKASKKQLKAARKKGHRELKAMDSFGKHHEAIEGLAAAKKRAGKQLDPIIHISKGGTGRHYDQSVLRGEKKVSDYNRHAYRGKSSGRVADFFHDIRTNHKDMITGKTEAQMRDMSRKKLRKYNKEIQGKIVEHNKTELKKGFEKLKDRLVGKNKLKLRSQS